MSSVNNERNKVKAWDVHDMYGNLVTDVATLARASSEPSFISAKWILSNTNNFAFPQELIDDAHKCLYGNTPRNTKEQARLVKSKLYATLQSFSELSSIGLIQQNNTWCVRVILKSLLSPEIIPSQIDNTPVVVTVSDIVVHPIAE